MFVAKLTLNPTMLPAQYFVKLFRRLSPPLGLKFPELLSQSQLITVVSHLKIPVTKSGMIGYRATLKSLVDSAVLKSR